MSHLILVHVPVCLPFPSKPCWSPAFCSCVHHNIRAAFRPFRSSSLQHGRSSSTSARLSRRLRIHQPSLFLFQEFTSPAEQRKLWVYRVTAPTTPSLISLAVGPFVVLPDVQAPAITHVCMPGHLKKLRQTVHFLHTAFRFGNFGFYHETQFISGAACAKRTLTCSAAEVDVVEVSGPVTNGDLKFRP